MQEAKSRKEFTIELKKILREVKDPELYRRIRAWGRSICEQMHRERLDRLRAGKDIQNSLPYPVPEGMEELEDLLESEVELAEKLAGIK